MTDFVALLRGINVGGKNLIPMAKLKECFEGLGFSEVATYIQSGNVIFGASKKSTKGLESEIEQGILKMFRKEIRVVVLSHDELKDVIVTAPKGFGAAPEKFRYDVIFLKPPLTPKEAIKDVPTKEGVDTAVAGKRALYFSRLIAKAAQSRISRVASLPVYLSMTIRNWNTTTKLLSLLDEREI